jgi:hypothetical protein
MVTAAVPGHRSAIAPCCAYGGGVSVEPRRSTPSGAASIALYTAMRVGVFIGVWLLLQLLSPLRGLWAVVIAIVVSGLISVFLLNRQRAAMSAVVGGFFGRINERIDAASQAEDDRDEEADSQGHGVGDDQPPGLHQRRDQIGADGSAANDPDRSDSPRSGHQP